MSAVFRVPRRNKNISVSTAAMWLVLGLAAIFFLVRYGQELLLAHDLSEKAAAQRVVNSKIRDENSRLAASLDYFHSDKYVEQRAREDLNLRRPDEEVLIPVTAEGTGQQNTGATPVPVGETGAENMPAPTRDNWQRWLELFLPSP